MHVRTDPFFETFSALPDPRKDINKKHLMFDMLFITLCAVISGVKSWEQIEEFAIDREDWLRKYIELPHGIPSHDAIRYLFLFLDAKAFNKAFAEWVEKIRPTLDENHIAIDGKTSRRSGSKSSSLKPLHSVSAWATDVSLVLGQVHVNEKSNEITAIPELLEMLELNGCLVSIDAMGCQKDIAAKIIDKEGDYVLALKANQKNLHEEVKDFFDDAIENNFRDTKIYKFQETEKDHGRLETRQYYVTSDIADLFEVKNWSGIKSIAMVLATRKINGQTSQEKRYYISSISEGYGRIQRGIRGHWGIENSLHWVLDVCFDEDQCRKRIKNSAAKISTVRKIAVNMLKTEISYKASIVGKILKAGRNTAYLEKVLGI